MTIELQKMAAIAALNKMMQQGYVSICTIDSIAKMLGVTPPAAPYAILNTLHCVNFSGMSQELKQAVPGLIKQCIDLEPDYRFSPREITVDRVVEASPPEKRGGILRLLGRS